MLLPSGKTTHSNEDPFNEKMFKKQSCRKMGLPGLVGSCSCSEEPGSWGHGGHCSRQPLPGEAFSVSPMSCHPVELCQKSAFLRSVLSIPGQALSSVTEVTGLCLCRWLCTGVETRRLDGLCIFRGGTTLEAQLAARLSRCL